MRLLGIDGFCYNSPKHSTTKMNPFQLILGIEAKQPMDLAIIRTSGTHSEGSNDTKKMAKDREERKL